MINNYHNSANFKENNLVFFASKSKGGPIEREKDPDRETKVTQLLKQAEEEKKQAKTAEEKKKTPVSQKLVNRYRNGKISGKVLDATYDILQDPDKRSDDHYKAFLDAIVDGNFPDNAEIALKYLPYLDGTEQERKEVGKFFRTKDGTISTRLLKSKLKELSEKREAGLNAPASETKEAIKNLFPDQAKKAVEKVTGIYGLNWDIEKPPEVIVEALDHHDLYRAKLWQKPTNAELDEQIDDLGEGGEHLRAAWVGYLKKVLSQFRKIKNVEKDSRKSGIDLNRVKELQSTKFVGKIKIDKIRFDHDDNADIIQVDATNVGSLVVDYIDEEGTPQSSGVLDFLNMIDGYDLHEEIKDLDELNNQLKIQTGLSGVQKGQTYNSKDSQFTVFEVKESEVVINHKDQLKPQTFSFGAFARYVKANNFVKKLTADEVAAVVEQIHKDQLAEIDSFGEGLEGKAKERFEQVTASVNSKLSSAKIPTKVGQPQEIRFKNDLGRWTDATIEAYENADGEIRWRIHEKRNVGAVGPIFTPRRPDIPNATIPGSQKKSLYHEGTPRIKTHDNITPRMLMKMAEEDQIEGQEQTPDQNEQQDGLQMPTDPNADSSQDSPEEDDGQGGVILSRDLNLEALPYEDVHKVGGMTKVERGFLRSVWTNTRFMSVDDLWELGKAGYEYYVRRFERRQKAKYSQVAKDVPFWAPEMQRINQASENEQVNQFKEALDQMSILDIQDTLKTTDNQDMMKACLITLCEKGQMLWEDIEFWRNLNAFVDSKYAIPIPSNGDPATIVSEKDQRIGKDFLQGAIDSVWGEGTYSDWYQQNKSKYASNIKSYYEEGKELEGTNGGHAKRLGVLLKQHKMGQFVDPHEYEGLIMHSIEYGKSSMQAKVYYMIEGVAATNADGRTILSFDRMAHLNSEMLVRFPLLEYLCARANRKDGKVARWAIDDYKSWIRYWDNGNPADPNNCSPTKNVDDFLWKYVLPSDHTQNRINKAIRNGENLDHDDMFGYLPPASEQIVTDVCKSLSGSKKFLTVEGYANAAPGFSQYMRSLSENGNTAKLVEAVKSFVRFEGIMMERFEKGDNGYQRFDDNMLNSGTIVSPTIPPITYFAECAKAIERVVYHYNDQTLIDVWETLRTETGDIRSDQNEKKKQDKVNYAFKRFGKEFSRVVKKDGGQSLTNIIRDSNLTGMPFTSDEEKDRQKALKQKSALDMA